jgi:hypothetical protein
MSIYVGDVVRLQVSWYNLAGALADPTTITLNITPKGAARQTFTYAGGAVQKSSTGVYYYDFTTTRAGDHQYRWAATGTPTKADQGKFTVEYINV